MVYYMKAMAAGLAKKVALPIAFAATALVPALAGNTTLKIAEGDGTPFTKIAFDQTKKVGIVMTSTGDNVSFVELEVTLATGLEYQGGFEVSEKLSKLGHTYKCEPVDNTLHITIYNDNLVSMGELTNEVIATFEVKANTKLTGSSNIGLEIIDLTDEEANQVAYQNLGDDTVEGTDGDNSLGTDAVKIDKSILPGEWNVYVTADNLADGVLTIDPTKGLFTPQTLSVNLKNTEALVGGISFRLILPQGLTLQEETVKLNKERTGDKSVSYTVIKEGGVNTNDYVIFLSGDTKALNLKDGAVIYFDVVADNTLAAAALTETAPDFKDVVTLNDITVTDIYSTAVKQSDYTFEVYNKNEEARWQLLNTTNGTLTEVEKTANTAPFDRVYDYSKVLAARNDVNTYIQEQYTAGELAVNRATADEKVEAYDTELTDAKVKNEALHDAAVEQYGTTLPDALAQTLVKPEEQSARAKAPAAVTDITGVWRVTNDNNEGLKNAYDAANTAIDAYKTKVEALYDQKSLEDPDKYDGALLTDSEAETSEVATLLKAAEEAIDSYDKLIKQLNQENDENEAGYKVTAENMKNEFDKIVEATEVTEETKAPARIIEDIADEKEAAYDAIDDINTKAIEQANAGELVNEKMPNAIVDQAVNDAKDAVKAYTDERDRLVQLNDDNYDLYNSIIQKDGAGLYGTSLQDMLDETEQAIILMPTNVDDPENPSGTLEGAYANYENFPEIKEAIDAAQKAIDDVQKFVDAAHKNGGLAFEDGEDGTQAVEAEIEKAVQAIQDANDVALQAKADNDNAFKAENEELLEKTINNLENYYGDFDGTNLEDQPETYQAAYEAEMEAVDNYLNELGKSNEKGMVAKDLANPDSDLRKAKDALDEALKNLQDVVDNLTAVNELVNEADRNLQDAEDKLKEIREDEKYKYIDSSEKTAALMDAIDEKIKDLHERIDAIDDDANNGKDDWKELLNKNGEVDKWLEDLQQIINEIEGALDAEGEFVDGLDQDIEKAVETYDKFHKRGDANMDGRVSMIDYNTIMGYVREEASLEDIAEEAARNEQESQLNVVQEPEFGTDIEINITDAIGALWIYLNGGTDEGLGLGDRYYSARAAEAESLLASETMVNGVRRIALNLNNVNDYTAAQLDLVLPEGATLVAATLGERSNGHELFVGSVKDGRQRIVMSNSQLNAFKGNEGAVLYIDVQGDGDVQFNNVIFATTHAQSTRFTVGAAAETTGIAGVKAAAEGEQVYSIGGRLMNAVKKGINIIRRADGTTQKVIKK